MGLLQHTNHTGRCRLGWENSTMIYFLTNKDMRCSTMRVHFQWYPDKSLLQHLSRNFQYSAQIARPEQSHTQHKQVQWLQQRQTRHQRVRCLLRSRSTFPRLGKINQLIMWMCIKTLHVCFSCACHKIRPPQRLIITLDKYGISGCFWDSWISLKDNWIFPPQR